MEPKQKVIVVGAGLSGLTAAYELSKNPIFEVTVLEASDRFGGRVLSADLGAVVIDLGGFMIFPWYKYFKRMLSEFSLGSETKLLRTNIQLMHTDSEKQFSVVNNSKFIYRLHIRMALNLIGPALKRKINFYEPDLDYFGEVTFSEYIDKFYTPTDPIHNMMNSIAVGYTYPSINDVPVATFIGFAYKLLMHRGFDNVRYLPGGTSKLIDAMVNAIGSNGGKVITKAKVTTVSGTTLHTSKGDFVADKIVFTNGFQDNLLGHLVPIKAGPDDEYYTDNYFVIFKTQNKPVLGGVSNWMVAYEQNSKPRGPRVVSIGDFGRAMDLNDQNILGMYIQIPHEDSHNYNLAAVENIAKKYLDSHFKNLGEYKVIGTHHWKKTMPLADIETLKAIRSIQGKNGYYFAGDYLGSPCMETAVYTGMKAAKLVMGTSD